MSLDSFNQNSYQGRIAIGEKAETTTRNGNKIKIPKKLDYFIATHNFDPKTNTAPKDIPTTENLKKKYGTDKPKELEVILVDDHYDNAFFTDYMNYPGKTCNCRGNGITAIRVNQDGTKTPVKCDYDRCEFRLVRTNNGVQNTCKPTGILTFILPEAARSGGVWKFVTHSQITIGKIRASLKNIFDMISLKGLKIKMKVNIVQVNVAKQGSQNLPIVEVELPYGYNELAQKLGAKSYEELIEKRAEIVKGALPDNKRIQELSTAVDAGAGYDGSADTLQKPNVAETSEQPMPEPPPQSNPDPIGDDEFKF